MAKKLKWNLILMSLAFYARINKTTIAPLYH